MKTVIYNHIKAKMLYPEYKINLIAAAIFGKYYLAVTADDGANNKTITELFRGVSPEPPEHLINCPEYVKESFIKPTGNFFGEQRFFKEITEQEFAELLKYVMELYYKKIGKTSIGFNNKHKSVFHVNTPLPVLCVNNGFVEGAIYKNNILLNAPMFFYTEYNKKLAEIYIDAMPLKPVFVYGTLKKGHGNNILLADDFFAGETTTANKYALYANGLPYLNTKKHIHRVKGELYFVEDISKLDTLEGHPYFYQREIILVNSGIAQTGAVATPAYTYSCNKESIAEKCKLTDGNYK